MAHGDQGNLAVSVLMILVPAIAFWKFELYTVDLLTQFYPPMSGLLSYGNAQIDALIDFGAYMLVIEIKPSLLTEPAKRNADEKADFRRKFIENERGKPKVIKNNFLQLVARYLQEKSKQRKRGSRQSSIQFS